ncbi:hypothetical protein Skr01_36160 [Sphaerisporangium krabiense]|nr:hypothetical protein Skr01_36160 [Sphaerisporangium krabiense]
MSRAAWGARAPRQRHTVPWSLRTEFFVHHTDGPVDQTMRSIQDFHMDGNGWSDIGYNHLVRDSGTIYEGRGWLVVGAHCPGHNRTGHSVAYIGRDTPTAAALRSMRWLYDEACRRAGRELKMLGHGERFATACPGSRLQAWVDQGMPIDGEAPPAPDPTEVIVKKLPVLRQGDKGWDVKTLHYLLLARDYGGLDGVDDTVFTPAHAEGVRGLQAAAGIEADGIVGPKTWPVLLRLS